MGAPFFLLCSGIELVPMTPEYPLGESRLRFSALARVSATRFSAPVAGGTADQNHPCGWLEPHQFVDLFRPPALPRRHRVPSGWLAWRIFLFRDRGTILLLLDDQGQLHEFVVPNSRMDLIALLVDR